MRRLPASTTVHYIQDNPKLVGSMSHSRYELYKSATSIAEYLRLHSGTKAQAYADLKHDFTHNFVLIPTTAGVRLIHPILSLAAFRALASIPEFVAQVLGFRPRGIGSIGHCCTGVEYLRLRITVIQLHCGAVNQCRT